MTKLCQYFRQFPPSANNFSKGKVTKKACNKRAIFED